MAVTPSLQPASGQCYSHVFENERIGLKRDLFWSFRIEFQEVEIEGERVEPSLEVEWIRSLPPDWRHLPGLHLGGAYGENGIEASFYTGEHDVADRFSLDVLERRGIQLRVRLGATLKGGFLGLRKTTVEAEHWIPYGGVLIVPDNLTPRPTNFEAATAVAAPFVDLASYEPVELYPFERGELRYRLPPRI